MPRTSVAVTTSTTAGRARTSVAVSVTWRVGAVFELPVDGEVHTLVEEAHEVPDLRVL
jgi:hypothetical protein